MVESARRATVTRETQVRSLPPEPQHAPVVEREMTPGSQPGGCGFESRRGFFFSSHLVVGERGHPAGFGRRRPQVRLLPARPCTLRGRGAAVLASLMSSRPWVRIPPARSFGGVAQRESARLSGDRPPVRVRPSPSWWPWCNGSTRGRDPRRCRFESGRPPLLPADAEHPVSSAACNADAFGLWWFDSTRPHRTGT